MMTPVVNLKRLIETEIVRKQSKSYMTVNFVLMQTVCLHYGLSINGENFDMSVSIVNDGCSGHQDHSHYLSVYYMVLMYLIG